MITEQDLQEAIAACEGELHPKASTCMKLASFYTIRDHLFPQQIEQPMYSFATPPPEEVEKRIEYYSDTEFGQKVEGKEAAKVLALMDELMDAIQVIHPRLYASVMDRLP